MINNYVIVTIKSWNLDNFNKLKSKNFQNNWILIENKNDLTYERLKAINPRYVFIPHWSWIIPKFIYDNFECIVFHMTDLPFGRGGSPLQNLISRGIYETKISAIRVLKGLDAGDIYCKEPLSLKEGNADELLKNASDIVFNKMIPYIIEKQPSPAEQEGDVIEFKRRTPDQSNISELPDLAKIYDYIRMLDGEGYLKAFIDTEYLKIEFYNVQQNKNELIANCKIKLKDQKDE